MMAEISKSWLHKAVRIKPEAHSAYTRDHKLVGAVGVVTKVETAYVTGAHFALKLQRVVTRLVIRFDRQQLTMVMLPHAVEVVP